METTNGQNASTATPASLPRPAVPSLFNLLASVKFAVTVVAFLVLACILGTVIPQDGQVNSYLAANPGAAATMAILGKLGLTHVFSAGWFTALLCTLCASLIVCSQRRFRAGIRTDGALRGRAISSLVLHSSFVLILIGALIRAFVGQHGSIQFRAGETVASFMTARGLQPLPFAVRLEKFEVERHAAPAPAHSSATNRIPEWGLLRVRWPEQEVIAAFPAQPDTDRILRAENEPPESTNAIRIRFLRYIPDFVMDTASRQITTRSQDPVNPAIQIAIITSDARTNTQWLFARHPEFTMGMTGGHSPVAPDLNLFYQHSGEVPVRGAIKTFRSTLAFLDAPTSSPLIRTLIVNAPVTHKGYTFYQSGYDERDPSFTSLQVVKDPGVLVVYLGFVLTIAGLVMLFFLYPQHPSKLSSPTTRQ